MVQGKWLTAKEKEQLIKRYNELDDLDLSHKAKCERLWINRFTMRTMLLRRKAK